MTDTTITLALVILFSVPMIYHSYRLRGAKRTLILLLNIVGIAVIVELIGVTSGAYTYTGQTLVLVTIFVGIGWIANTYPAMHISLYLLNLYNNKRIKPQEALVVAILSGCFGVIYDLFMDPVAVALGTWVWAKEGPWYGVPLSNFIGWFLIIFSIVFGYTLVDNKNASIPKKALLSIISIVLGSALVYLAMKICAYIGI